MIKVFDIHDIVTSLRKAEDGIWYSPDKEAISYPSDGNECCFSVEEKSFWFKHRNACITEVVSAFSPGDNGSIFDIGGGKGFVSLGLANAGFDVVLVEPGRSGASNAKKRGLVNVICATVRTARFKEQSLSAVGLFDVLEHIEDDKGFLQSIHTALINDGMLYLTVPAYPFLWSKEDELAGHYRRYTVKTVSTVLASADFEIIYATYIFRFLPLLVFLFRTIPFRLGLVPRANDQNKEEETHKVSKKLTAHILDGLMTAEVLNLRNKKSMGFGSSCLIVAKRGKTRTTS